MTMDVVYVCAAGCERVLLVLCGCLFWTGSVISTNDGACPQPHLQTHTQTHTPPHTHSPFTHTRASTQGVINDWRIIAAWPLLMLIDLLLKTPPIARALFDNLAKPPTITKVGLCCIVWLLCGSVFPRKARV